MTVFDLLMKIEPMFNKVKIVSAIDAKNVDDNSGFNQIIQVKGFSDDFRLYYSGIPRQAPIGLAPCEVDSIHVDSDGSIVVMLEDE